MKYPSISIVMSARIDCTCGAYRNFNNVPLGEYVSEEAVKERATAWFQRCGWFVPAVSDKALCPECWKKHQEEENA